CAAYGTWQEKSMYGKKYMGVARTTYLVGPDGTVALGRRLVEARGRRAARPRSRSCRCRSPPRT
ncbi:MAG: hypothetical protein ACKOFI_11050, partial [Phycisphaerales bacterium]